MIIRKFIHYKLTREKPISNAFSNEILWQKIAIRSKNELKDFLC